MELFTPNESVMCAALAFERAALKTEQSAINCGVDLTRLQFTKQETRLTVIRCLQAKNQLAQVVKKTV